MFWKFGIYMQEKSRGKKTWFKPRKVALMQI